LKRKYIKDKPAHYVNPEEFSLQIREYYKTGEMHLGLGEAIFNIATRLGYRPNFAEYTYREEMIGDAILNMVKALENKKFDPDRGNAFSYFGKIAWHAFVERIKKENKEHETVDKYKNEVYDQYIQEGYVPDDQSHEHHSIDNY